jgi:hypothetical protein
MDMKKVFTVGIIVLILWLLFTFLSEQDVFAAMLPAKDKEPGVVPPPAPLPVKEPEVPSLPGTVETPKISVDIPMPDFSNTFPKVELGDVASKIGIPTSLPSLATKLPSLSGIPVPVVGAIATLAERGYYIISRTIGLIFGSSNLPESKFVDTPVTFYPIHYGKNPAEVLELFRSALIELTPEQAAFLSQPIQATISINEYAGTLLQNALATFDPAVSSTWAGYAPDEIREGYTLEQRRLANVSALEAQANSGYTTEKWVFYTSDPSQVGETDFAIYVYKEPNFVRRPVNIVTVM